jgi:inner membrane protein
MPLVDRWKYGDVLFIVDPWIWGLLAAGIYLSKRRAKVDQDGAGRPARAALGVVVAYIALMAVAGGAARSIVASELPRHGLNAQARFMVAPVPVNPFRRVVVVEDRSGYRLGTFHWLPNPTVEFEDVHIARGDDNAAARLAAATDRGRTFLHWARFPFFVVSPSGGSLVYIVDARYTLDEHAGFGAVAISVERD